jgi:hypothetical protein
MEEKFPVLWLIMELSYVAPSLNFEAEFTGRHQKILSRCQFVQLKDIVVEQERCGQGADPTE